MRRWSLLKSVVLLAVVTAAVPVLATVTAEVTLVPERPGPDPYPVLPAYPFDLHARGEYHLDAATSTALAGGEALLSETYAWAYAPAEAWLAPAQVSGRFLYAERYAGEEHKITVTYTVTVTWLKDDRLPEQAVVSDTVDLVVLSNAVRLLENGGAELYVDPPGVGGVVCDMIGIYAKVYSPYVPDKVYMRREGEPQWTEVTYMGGWTYPSGYALWSWGWSTADVPDMKNTIIEWRVTYLEYPPYEPPPPGMPPPPPPDPIAHYLDAGWDRHNTVVHCPLEKVLKWDPYDAQNCDTDIVFSIGHLDYGNPDWAVTATIYNAGGAAIRTLEQEGGFVLGENTLQWDGNLAPPPLGPGTAPPKGIYTYTVEVVHTIGGPYWPNAMCTDRDKASTPELRVTSVRRVSFDVPTLVLTLDADYEVLQGAAVNARLAVFDPGFNQIAFRYIGPNGDGLVPAGYSGTERFSLQPRARADGAVHCGVHGPTDRHGRPSAPRPATQGRATRNWDYRTVATGT